MLAMRRRIRPLSLNSQFSLPYARNQLPESSCNLAAAKGPLPDDLLAEAKSRLAAAGAVPK